MSVVKTSPSGPAIEFGPDTVFSVFGRVGVVASEVGDYTSGMLPNDSTAIGSTLTDVLDTLDQTNGINNDSAVAGSSVTAALATLRALVAGGPGSIRDTFCGGSPIPLGAVANANAGVGDRGWNWALIGLGTGVVGAPVPGSPGVIGAYRITGSTTSGRGANLYLGQTSQRSFIWEAVSVLDFRARFDGNQDPVGQTCQLGVLTSMTVAIATTGSGAGFMGQLETSPNYQSVTTNSSASTIKDTGVPIDDEFHVFRIVRVSFLIVEFYIDQILVATHDLTNGDMIPPGVAVVNPFVGAVGGNGSATFTEIDNFQFTPA